MPDEEGCGETEAGRCPADSPIDSETDKDTESQNGRKEK